MPFEIGDTCKRGHVIDGDNVQHYKNRGIPHVRCATCNKPPRNKARKRGDSCKHGHLLDGPNYGTRTINGKVQVFCRACHRQSVRKNAGLDPVPTPNDTERAEEVAYRKASDKADALIEQGKVDVALSYIRLNKRADRAADALHKKLAQVESNCANNPGPFVDYDEDDTPTPLEAYVLCQGCPALLECARFATAYKPAVGVWGGEVYIDGKPVR
jgi:hypothetical protein